MPVYAGIVCRNCQRLYFVATSPCVEPRDGCSDPVVFQLSCANCKVVRVFVAADMRPYSISTYAYQRGFASWGEYRELARAG